MMRQYLADVVLVVHGLFVAFVVFGMVLIVTGMVRGWRWIRNPWFRSIHLLAIGLVVVESWIGMVCPLTEWENYLRNSSGGAGYSQSFIGHWLQRILFYDFAPWVFTVAYTAFGALVLIAWLLAPPGKSARRD